jgi:hypothetical protein
MQHMAEQAPSGGFVQHFGQVGAHARSFPGGKDDDGDRLGFAHGVRHSPKTGGTIDSNVEGTVTARLVPCSKGRIAALTAFY